MGFEFGSPQKPLFRPEFHSGLLCMLVQWELKDCQDYPSGKRSGSCQVLRSLVNVLRSVFIVLVISTHHSTFLTFSCQKKTPGSLPDFCADARITCPQVIDGVEATLILSPDLP